MTITHITYACDHPGCQALWTLTVVAAVGFNPGKGPHFCARHAKMVARVYKCSRSPGRKKKNDKPI